MNQLLWRWIGLRVRVVGLLGVIWSAHGTAALAQTLPPSFDDTSWRAFYDFILPEPAELAWRDIAWEATLWDALLRAQREDKPVLIWAMNGHPLGCT